MFPADDGKGTSCGGQRLPMEIPEMESGGRDIGSQVPHSRNGRLSAEITGGKLAAPSVQSGVCYAEREPILAFGRPRGGAAEVKRPSVVLPQIELCVFFSYEKKD